MKRLFLSWILFLAFTLTVSAQIYHYTFAYAIDSKGQKNQSNYPSYSREYSIKYTDGKNFIFCMPNGNALSKAWLHNMNNGSMNQTHKSNNICRYKETKYVSGKVSGNFDCYTVEDYHTVYIPGLANSAGTEYWAVHISTDKKLLVVPASTVTLVYQQIPKRTISEHAPMATVQYMPSTTTTPSSSSYSTSGTSSSSTSEVMVGSYAAFGLSQAYGNTVTHNYTFTIYRDNSGYYVKESYGKKYLFSNSRSSYLGYDVSGYNYTMLGASDVSWYFRLP